LLDVFVKLKELFGGVPVDKAQGWRRAAAHKRMAQAVVELTELAVHHRRVREVRAVVALMLVLGNVFAVLHNLHRDIIRKLARPLCQVLRPC
jgi:hypothetical protein